MRLANEPSPILQHLAGSLNEIPFNASPCKPSNLGAAADVVHLQEKEAQCLISAFKILVHTKGCHYVKWQDVANESCQEQLRSTISPSKRLLFREP